MSRSAGTGMRAIMASLAMLAAPVFAAEAPLSCAEVLADAPAATAERLFDGAVACGGEGREPDALFVMVAGQVRAMSDMLMFAPRPNDSPDGAAALYARLFYQMGGAGPVDFYADADAVRTLFARVDAWIAVAGDDRAYRPSWRSEPVADLADYGALLAETWTSRRRQLESLAESARNPEYVRVQGEIDRLMRENPRGFDVGTDAYERMQALGSELTAAGSHRETDPPATPIADRIARVPDPANLERTLHVGFSGRADMHGEVFRSAAAARQGWLGRAIPPIALDALLAKVDFTRESLYVLSTGKATTATGEVVLMELRADDDGWRIGASVAVQPSGCDQPRHRAYPFVVARGPRVDADTPPSVAMSNRAGPCVPAMSGTEAEDP